MSNAERDRALEADRLRRRVQRINERDQMAEIVRGVLTQDWRVATRFPRSVALQITNALIADGFGEVPKL